MKSKIQWNCFGRLCIFAYLWASSSRVYTSGYCVFSKYLSNISSCSAVNVVLARLCFLFNVNPGSDSQSESSELDPPKIFKYRIQRLNFIKKKLNFHNLLCIYEFIYNIICFKFEVLKQEFKMSNNGPCHVW